MLEYSRLLLLRKDLTNRTERKANVDHVIMMVMMMMIDARPNNDTWYRMTESGSCTACDQNKYLSIVSFIEYSSSEVVQYEIPTLPREDERRFQSFLFLMR